MESGSKYVLMYDLSDEEVVSETELNEGMWLRCVCVCVCVSTHYK